MRIAIGQLWQETNTNNPLPTTRHDFESFGVLRGREFLEKMAETNEPGGFIQSLRAWPEKPEIVPLLRLPAWPSGRATSETFDWLKEEMASALRAALPVDAVLLALHGAMAADGHPDVEGEILDAVRGLVGDNIPIVASLDLHCCLTERMVAASNALVLYHTAPHIDVYETGARAAAVLHKILVGGARPRSSLVRVPGVFPVERANTQDPASPSHSLRLELEQLERRPGVLAAGLATVQPWLDIPGLASAVLVVTDNDAALAQRESHRIARLLWSKRREYLTEVAPLDTAVRAAAGRPEGLTVLSDSADATTSGSPGDSTWALKEMLLYQWTRPALVTLVAPEAIDRCQSAGVGATFSMPLGGRRDHRHSTPVSIAGRVDKLFDAKFVLQGHLGKNMAIDMGPSAVLRTDNNIRIVLTSRTGPHFAPALFEAAGLDPFAAQLLIAKSPCGFRAAYADRAAVIQVVKAPGCSPAEFWKETYHQIPRPLWPWDDDVSFTP